MKLAGIKQVRKHFPSSGMGDPDPESRAQERHRRAVFTGVTSAISRAVRVGVSLITIPLTLHYLGVERFGLWMTISSILAMAAFADFGIGNGVLNTVADASGKDDLEGIRRAISSGFFVLLVTAVILLMLFLSAYHVVSWADLFRVNSVQARREAGPATLVFVVCFVLNIPLDLVQRAQLGLQQGYRPELWQLCSNIAALLGVLFAIHFRLGLPGLLAVFAGAPVVGVTMNLLHFFGVDRRDLLPRWRFVSRKTMLEISRLGGLFFVLQLFGALAFSTDTFIVARVLGASNVAVFSIPQRMFSVIALLVSMFMTPLWPAYGEAISRGDMSWVQRTLSRTLLAVFVLTAVASSVLLALSNRLILWWVGPQIHPPFLLLLGLAIWTVMNSCGNALAMFMNGASIIRFQVITALICGIGCVITKVLFARHYGIVGVPWATIITYALLIAFPHMLYVPRLLKNMVAPDQSGSLSAGVYGVIDD
jgi:O-antigen/teichoic acid export membrane protein